MVHTPVPQHLRRSVSFALADGVQPADPKTEAHENKAVREMAEKRPCLIQFPDICNHDPDTTVACHSNWSDLGGKAGARKADDEYTVWGCSACHHRLDFGSLTWDEKRATFMAAHARQVFEWERIAEDLAEPIRFRRAARWALNHLMRK